MKLTSISARNFKGLNFDLTFPSGLVLVGDNFAGKSARADAVRLLLLGYLPEQGRTAKATFGLSSGRVMSVRGTTSDGRELFRSWTLRGDSVKSEEEGFPEDGEEDEVEEQLATMLDAATYFEKGPTARIDYVFANVPRGAIELPSPEKLVEEIRSELSGLDQKEVETLVVEIDAGISGVSRKLPQAYLEKFLELVSARTKAKRAESTRMEKTIQGLSQLRIADPAAKTVAELEAELRTANERKDRIAERITAVRVELSPYAAAEVRRREIKTELAVLRANATAADDLRRELEEVEREISELAAKRDAACPDPDRFAEELAAARAFASTLSNDFGTANARRAQARADLEKIETATLCPYCGASGDGWKALRRAELLAEVEALGETAEKTSERLSKAEKEVSRLEAISTLLRDFRGRLGLLSARKEGFQRKFRTAEAPSGRIEALEQELGRLPSGDPAALRQTLSDLESELGTVKNEIRAVETLRSGARAKELELSRFADAEKARDAAAVALLVSSAAEDAVAGLKARLVEKVFEPLLREANALFPGILRSPIAYHDGEIGTWRSGSWIGHRTFSGTEKALVYGAIQLALAARSPFRILILDELGRLSDANLRKVENAVGRALEAGKIEQFVGIDAGRKELHEETLREWTENFAVVEVSS